MSLKYEPASEPQYFNKRLHAIGGYNGAKYLSALAPLWPPNTSYLLSLQVLEGP